LTQCLKNWLLLRLSRNCECRTKVVGDWMGRKLVEPDPTPRQRFKMWVMQKLIA